MSPVKYLLLCITLLLAGSSLNAWAQNVVFTAQPSASKIGIKDQLQLSYTIQNAKNLTRLDPGALSDFNLLGGPFQSTFTSISSVNGHTTQSVNLTVSYILQPKKTGRLNIPAAVATDAEGHSYQSNALSIEVVNGSLAPQQSQQAYDPFGSDPFFQDPFAQQWPQRQQPAQQPPAQVNMNDISKDLFIRVDVDKTKAHVGEQITASYKLYARLPMNAAISKLPSLNGFWTQDFEIPQPPKPVEEIFNGKKYQVFLLKKSALFPQQTGTLELDPAEAEGVARILQQVHQRNPFADMFDNDPFFQKAFGGSFMMNDPFFDNSFFSQMAYKDVPVHLKSTPVKINVTALPETGKPADYTGAVGQFSVSAKMDKAAINTEETSTITLTISGSGNLKLIGAPVLKLPNGLTAYDPEIRDTITGRSTTISGSRIFTYTLSPSVPGDYTIPPVTFSFFNPKASVYTTLSTQPFHLNVKPGPGYKETQRHRTVALNDIHDISTAPVHLSYTRRPLLYTVGYWSAYALPLMAFIVLLGWRKREEELSKDQVKLKGRKANKIALKRLSLAQKLLKANQKQAYYEEVSKAVWLYLSDKFNIPLAQLSKDTVGQALAGRNIPEAIVSRVQQVINDCELALYAPAGSQHMQNTYQEALTVISELEEKI